MNIAFLSATALLQAIRAKRIGCLEILDYFLNRVKTINPQVNAVIAFNIDDARKRAQKADEALVHGKIWGILHGLPMTVKDVYETIGMPTTAGAEIFQNHFPKKNADVVQRLVNAGAIIFGKTNVPEYAADWQTYNKIYGRTNNPWNLNRTPGGSSGGAAAALASGLTPLEVGSDLCGSMRIPAHYCGIYSHRSTYGIVSLLGHIPGVPGKLSQSDLASGGPLARYADDLELALNVISGPCSLDSCGWQLQLPLSRAQSLKDYRVAVWLSDDFCPIDEEFTEKYNNLITFLQKKGVKVYEIKPNEIDLQQIYELCLNLTGSVMGLGLNQIQTLETKFGLSLFKVLNKFVNLPRGIEHYYKGMIQTHIDWQKIHEKRLHLRQFFSKFFERYDVLLTPVIPWVAPQHMYASSLFSKSKITLNNNETRQYIDHVPWISLATLLGLPATSAPISKNHEGLPINLQIVGGPYQDRTTINFARRLEEIFGGFIPPKNFVDIT